jgi:hypothetical protein
MACTRQVLLLGLILYYIILYYIILLLSVSRLYPSVSLDIGHKHCEKVDRWHWLLLCTKIMPIRRWALK